MRRPAERPYLPLVIVAGLLVALASLAVLQYRWIAKLSEAERDRLKANLDSSAARFRDDFDRELTRAHQSFQPREGLAEFELEGDLVARLARWRSTAPVPRLVRELLVVTRLGRGEVELRRLDEESGRLVTGSWEPGLDSVRQIFEARGRVPVLDERLPGLVLPVRAARPPRDGGPEGERDRRPPRDGGPEDGDGRRPPRDHVVVRLDADFVKSEFLPLIAEREFGGRDGLAYAVTVAVAAEPGNVIFRGGPRIEGATGRAGGTVQNFFALRFFQDLASPAPRGERLRRETGAEEPAGERVQLPGGGTEPGRWILSVQHPSGSLEDAVSGARRRNLVISFAILVLLGSTVVLLVVSTRRAQQLARQQMDFVAGVSHELQTPLTAMRSAGQNLADGIVDTPEKVRKYGTLIEREGRRLTEMVGRVLTFAGIQSGPQTLPSQPVSVGDLVEGVLADCRWVVEERHVEVEKNIADGLPPVRGDAASLRQALANLVDNALKYGGPARWIGVNAKVETTPRGEKVVLAVSDRGIGIRRGDVPHVFEPFFRSADPSAAGIAGSGLGLAVVRGIVEAHGGSVSVESVPGKGSTFAIHLPATPPVTGKGAGT